MIRTAIPFGYLLIALFLAATSLTGIGLLIGGAIKRSGLAVWLGAGMVGFVTLIVIGEMSAPEVEWNPMASDTEIVGTYAEGDDTVTLRLDKTFTYRTASKTVSGTWQTDDWHLYLNVEAEPTYNIMRFIQADGRYYLMPHEQEDLDMWDGDLGLPKVE